MRLIFIIFFVALIFPNDFKNLKVLDIKSKGEMQKYMKSISKDLGVKCSHCHDMDDKSLDTPEKEIAREMIVLTRQINEYLFSLQEQDTTAKNNQTLVSCWTCHKGDLKVEHKRPIED
tara:strand:- start:121 stop:474 length:354 start_codon:yes stop_codon:yes gene_type:complete